MIEFETNRYHNHSPRGIIYNYHFIHISLHYHIQLYHVVHSFIHSFFILSSLHNGPLMSQQGPPPFDVDSLLLRVLNVGAVGGRLTHAVSEADLIQCCGAAKAVFQSQSSLVEIDPPVVVCGDIHGQYADLLRIFDKEGFPPDSNYLFLGDYVDRGRQNIETIILMFCYKIKYSGNFFMLRGNHECPAINRVYGFYEECNRRFKSTRLWQIFNDTFAWMPLCALTGGRILSMHGGLSPQLTTLDQLRKLPRPQDPPNPSMGIDLLWSDPDPWVKGWQANTRGASYVFGQDVVMSYCENLGLDLIARAHQVVQDGYEFFASRRLVTLFSAPHYCGQFDNHAATMRVDADMRCTFVMFKATAKAVRLALAQEIPQDVPSFIPKSKL